MSIDFIHRWPLDGVPEDWRLVGEFRCCNRTDLRFDMPDLLLVGLGLDTGPHTYTLSVTDLDADFRRMWEDEAAWKYNNELARQRDDDDYGDSLMEAV